MDNIKIERITSEHFGNTTNKYHQIIFVPCTKCREHKKEIEAYWITLDGSLRLCDWHAKGYTKIC